MTPSLVRRYPKPSLPLLLTAPTLFVIAALALYPIAFGIWAGMHQWNWALGQADNWTFNGIKNYVAVLTDKRFGNSIRVTLYFTVLAVGLELVIGLGLALLLASIRRGAWFFRAAIIFPLMISDIVAGLIASVLLEPTLGPINALLGGLGLPRPNWIGDPTLVIPVLAVVDTWWQTGNIVLILLAGLTSIPTERVEMASLDGAKGWSMFRYITLPALMPFLLVALVFRTIDALRVFALAWTITKGGPSRASEVTQFYIYQQGLGRFFNMGYASAAASVFAILIALIAGVYLLFMARARESGRRKELHS